MLSGGNVWVRSSKRFKQIQTRAFCTSSKKPNNEVCKVEPNANSLPEAYRRLENLDFMTAAKILFTEPPNTKKFGLDFHLVQLFFVCMPSLAVYLVAQYARHEMRKMDAELEEKKKKEEEKTKEMEENAIKEKEAEGNPELLNVKERLDKLEDIVKEIAVVSKKQQDESIKKTQGDHSEKKRLAVTEAREDESASVKNAQKD